MLSIDPMQKAIREERLDGWLFCNFSHRDTFTDALLNLDIQALSSRRWFYYIPASGEPIKIVHIIESNILSELPGTSTKYASLESLKTCLRQFSGQRIAILFDPEILVLSTIDASSYNLLVSCGIDTVSASTLIQRIKGILDEKGIQSHENAARILYKIVHKAWNFAKTQYVLNTVLCEGDIQDFILTQFDSEGLITDYPPIVAFGSNSGNPHYCIAGHRDTKKRGAILQGGDVVQFDLWAKFPEGIYADISWIAYCGKDIPKEIQKRFAIVTAARDLVKPAIKKAFQSKTCITGKELDTIVRVYLLEHCPPEAIQHRTGHGIDTQCHGSGTNLDSIEFPDFRAVLEGSCFSVEPGIYFPDSGFRTEINIYIQNGKPVISGGEIQTSLFTL